MKILEVENLTIEFTRKKKRYPVVDQLSFTLEKGEVLGLVGESGSGKTMTALSILGLIDFPGKVTNGKILYYPPSKNSDLEQKNPEPIDLLSLPEKEKMKFRGNRIAMIFQEPMTALNPVLTIGDQLLEPIILHQKLHPKEAYAKGISLLQKVHLSNPEQRMKEYPHQLSGGMRQRVMIAMALACEPEILIADEPTTALDVTLQAQILDLIRELIQESQMSMILITHDLGVVSETCNKVLVLYAGKKVEESSSKILFRRPKHPYTIGLLHSIPTFKTVGPLQAIPGNIPEIENRPEGCVFHNRCNRAVFACEKTSPSMRYIGEKQFVRCLNG